MVKTTLLYKIRGMVLSGELAPGERITEMKLAERLGVSRTPVRSALPALEAEGFLEVRGKRGYSVASFSAEKSAAALEIRAGLEGMAARNLARDGISPETLKTLEECLTEGDKLFCNQEFSDDQYDQYGQMNLCFHQTIVQAGGADILQSFVARLNNMPFISPAGIVFEQGAPSYRLLQKAHDQHHDIVEAIRERDPVRAEMLFREHAYGQKISMFSIALREARKT